MVLKVQADNGEYMEDADIIEAISYAINNGAKISSIVMKPVCLELHDDQSSVTRISADSAVIRLKKRYIFFKGNVRAVSGKRVLTTSRLSLFPEKAVIRTEQHFILKTPEKNLEGERLMSDIFLKPVFSPKKAKSGSPA